jgi:guanosine-3',5'-bis(diphosphate) 3'-pyrophosphohydrolase
MIRAVRGPEPSVNTATKKKKKSLAQGSGPCSLLPKDLLAVLEGFEYQLDLELIALAFQYSVEKHEGQKRASGEDYVTHCVEVAKILSEIDLGSTSIAASLLHDVVEDTDTTVDDIRVEFGDEVATIVDGLTKLAHLEFGSIAERQAETYRKLLLSMARDARVILIKLADRLHNMRTLEHMPEETRKRIALETREIYAPLAHRLGVGRLKWELEDLAFKFIEPEIYRELAKTVKSKRRDREAMIREMVQPLQKELKAAEIQCEVTGRPKHLWSIYGKMIEQDKPFEEVYDTLAMRIIVETVRDCYYALGVVHNKWTPLTERLRDFIATPKSNMYQSLHTTVFGTAGALYEIQIRTRDMHGTAEYGIASHWRYKEGIQGPSDEVDEKLSWLHQVLEWQHETREPEEFLEFLRIDLFQDEIFIFTPAGDVKQLPKGATAIDFAFSVHTEIGMHCSGAKANGRIIPLSRPLENGETVEVLTSEAQTPSRDWLGFIRTSKARHTVRQWIRQEEHGSATRLGQDIIKREWKRYRRGKLDEAAVLKAVQALGHHDVDALYASVAHGDVSLTRVIHAMLPESTAGTSERLSSALDKLVDKVWHGGNKGIQIQGLDDLMVRYSQCCQPVPGDDVMGYITRGRGVSVHRTDCPNVLRLPADPERRVKIDWGSDGNRRFLVRILMEGTDRHGLFADIAKAVTETGTNIQLADIKSVEGGMRGQFVIEVEHLRHLEKVTRKVRRVKGVILVQRKESFGEHNLTLE